LIDRMTRIPIIIKLKSKDSAYIMKQIVKLKDKYWIKSVTFDNWMEFAKHYLLNEVWIDTYFSDPYSPWQKGSIENLNRIIRRFFPKWTIFDNISSFRIKKVCNIIANSPREMLDYLSPYQVHFK
jgi:IS30 family transposase